MRGRLNTAYALIETMIAMLVAICVLQAAISCLQMTLRCYLIMSKTFKLQHNQAIIRHYMQADLHNDGVTIAVCARDGGSCSLAMAQIIQRHAKAATSNILVIVAPNQTVLYYLRKSVLSKPGGKKFALYRDDIVYNAQALVEDLQNFQVDIVEKDAFFWMMRAQFTFAYKSLEMQCLIPKPPMATF